MIIIKSFFKLPMFFTYWIYDICVYLYLKMYRRYYGWGIHLITGRFGSGKSSVMVKIAYDIVKKYPYLTILTNLPLSNFPDGVNLLKLNTVDDILNAPDGCLCLIDEIGTIFNSRDFSSGKCAVPKSLFQHLCQCRKRNLTIYGTVQRYNLLDKQIRDISAYVTVCHSYFCHPFTRFFTYHKYDIDDYDYYSQNPSYIPRPVGTGVYVQRNLYRNLYDTTDMVDNILNKEYLTDKEILENRGVTSTNYQQLDRRQRKTIHRNITR